MAAQLPTIDDRRTTRSATCSTGRPRTWPRCGIFDPEHPEPGGRRRGRAVVHDALRPRLAAHVVDGDDGRPRPRARDAADAGALPGQGRRPRHRGGAGPHPARDALRRDRPRSRSAAAASTTAPSTRRRCSSCCSASSRRWGTRPEEVDALLPAADRALEWIDEFGDRDGDGYVEYQRATDRGLENQGWKDSWDSTRFADGELAAAADRALRGAGVRLRRAAAPVPTSRTRRGDAARVDRLERAPRTSRPRSTATSGSRIAAGSPMASTRQAAGRRARLEHGPLPVDRASSTRTRRRARRRAPACRDEMFSGWGVRTLATSMVGYNPLSYHNGSVWPHDNAICVAGLMRYGLVEDAHRVMRGIVDAGGFFGHRLPELFGGLVARRVRVPGQLSHLVLAAGVGRAPRRCCSCARCCGSSPTSATRQLHSPRRYRSGSVRSRLEQHTDHGRTACRSRPRATGSRRSTFPTVLRLCAHRGAQRPAELMPRGARVQLSCGARRGRPSRSSGSVTPRSASTVGATSSTLPPSMCDPAAMPGPPPTRATPQCGRRCV